VVIEEGGVGVVKFGFKVEYESDLDDIEKKAKQFGLTVERMSAGENPEVSDGIRFITPSEHVIEVYHGQTLIGTEVGTHNPDSFPRHLVGVGVPALDHALIFADDVRLMENMFREVFDYFPTERVQTDLNDDDAHFIASWMTSNNQIHQIAVLEGEQAKLHHFAFKLQDWAEVGRAADIMTMDDVPIDIGPTRHGITRGQTVYFFDPSGNRNEVFAGGYETYPDFPTITWTADHTDPAVSYIGREVRDNHFTVDT
jgi:catechol 2,3-dioxygenase